MRRLRILCLCSRQASAQDIGTGNDVCFSATETEEQKTPTCLYRLPVYNDWLSITKPTYGTAETGAEYTAAPSCYIDKQFVEIIIRLGAFELRQIKSFVSQT